MARVEDAEPAEAVEILAALDIRERAAVVGPLDGRRRRAGGDRLAVLEEAGVDVFAETRERFGRDPGRLPAIEGRGVDEV